MTKLPPMIDLALLTPTNLLAEKAKFMASSTYEPQFLYQQPISPEILTHYGLPQKRYFDYAVKKLRELAELPKLSELAAAQSQSTPATPNQVSQLVSATCQAAQIPEIKLDFSHEHLSGARLSQGTLYIRTPILFSELELKGKIHHEVETHYLRTLNNAVLGLPDPVENLEFRSTEEGLANLHSYLDESTAPMQKTLLGYTALYLAQQLSFRGVYQELLHLGVSTDRAWSLVIRNKRGMADTSLPGGFTKDRAYFEGAVAVWQWLLTPGNSVKDLYLGRISLSEVTKTKAFFITLQPQPALHFPQFVTDEAGYLATIKKIGETNHFAELLP